MTPETEVVPEGAPETPAGPGAAPAPGRGAGYAGLGIWGAVGLCLLFQLVAGFTWIELALLQVLLHVRMHPAAQFLVGHAAGMVTTLWAGLPRAGLPPVVAFPLRRFRARLVAPMVLAAWGFLVLVPWDSLPQPPSWLLEPLAAVGRGGWLPALLVAGVAAPVLEELFFRGLLLGALRRRYSTTTAVIVSTGLFMLVHANVPQGTAALIIGLGACWLVLRTGSLIPGMLLHAVWNSSSGFITSATGSHPGAPAAGRLAALVPMAGALAAAIGVVVLWWQLRRIRPAAGPTPVAARRAPARLWAAFVLPIGFVVVTGNFAPIDRALALMGMPARHRTPTPNPRPWEGCYQLTTAGAPLTLLGDPGATTLQLRLALDTLPQAGGVTHYAARPIDTPAGRPVGGPPYWFIDSGRGLRIVRTRPDGGTIVRLGLGAGAMEGSVMSYAATGDTLGARRRVTARRIACPAAPEPPGR